jgi:FHA domain
MSHSIPSSVSDCCPLSFLEQNPGLSDSLFADCGFNLDEVTTIIEPVLQAKKRCQVTSFYIQAVTTGRTTFLATNLPEERDLQITPIASSWLVGRSSTCAIALLNASVSRRHAVLGHDPKSGFYITDVGSSNGTWVNGHQLMPMERYLLQDGDLVRLGKVRVEFFAVTRDCGASTLSDATCF